MHLSFHIIFFEILVFSFLSISTIQGQESSAFYTCSVEPKTKTVAIGVTLCDALATPKLSALMSKDNLQLRNGALIFDITANGVAKTAGLKKDDMIYRIKGIDITDAETAAEQLRHVPLTSDIVINFLRDGRPYRVKLRKN